MTPRFFLCSLFCIGLPAAAPLAARAAPAQTNGCANTIVVQNNHDSGAGSLRQAVLGACNGATISFAGRFIIALQTPIDVGNTLTLDGSSQAQPANASGDNLVQILGDATHRLFLVNVGGDLSLRRLRLSNAATTDRGGAILSKGRLAVFDSRFDGNSTGTAGGGAISNAASSTLLVEGSTFDGNSSLRGAAIYNEGDAEIYNSTFSGNVGITSEGAIQNRGTLLAVHITVANNGRSGANTGGVFAFNADTTLVNSVIADNAGDNCRASNGTTSADTSLIESGNCGALTTADPQLLPLAARGGVTLTHGLAATSPAIDAAAADFCLPADQRGIPRPLQNGCDLGALENEDIFGDGFDGVP